MWGEGEEGVGRRTGHDIVKADGAANALEVSSILRHPGGHGPRTSFALLLPRVIALRFTFPSNPSSFRHMAYIMTARHARNSADRLSPTGPRVGFECMIGGLLFGCVGHHKCAIGRQFVPTRLMRCIQILRGGVPVGSRSWEILDGFAQRPTFWRL